MKTPKTPSLLEALLPVIILIVLLTGSVFLFGSDAIGGATQIVLIVAAAVAAIIAVRNGHRWRDIERAIVAGIGTAMGAILILLAVGALIGAWLLAGTVPAMIYYGLQLLHPQFFFAATCLICAVASFPRRSSWRRSPSIAKVSRRCWAGCAARRSPSADRSALPEARRRCGDPRGPGACGMNSEAVERVRSKVRSG